MVEELPYFLEHAFNVRLMHSSIMFSSIIVKYYNQSLLVAYFEMENRNPTERIVKEQNIHKIFKNINRIGIENTKINIKRKYATNLFKKMLRFTKQ